MRALCVGLVLGAMVVVGVAVNGCNQAASLYESQVRACERGNKVRVTLHDFLSEASKSRAQLAKLEGDPEIAAENRTASRHYRKLARGFSALDCRDSRVVRKP